MKLQERYWDQKIKEWTESSYQKKFSGVKLLERIANLFRGPVTGRMMVALGIVGLKAKNKTILDLGCGLGDFCFAVLKYHPKKVIGVDISRVAVRVGQQIAKKKKVTHLVKFIQADVGQMEKLPEFDIAVGLGFIDYLTKEELMRLFRLMGRKSYLFSLFEKRLSLRNLLHEVYIRLKKCPGAYKYSRKEIKQVAPKNSGLNFLEKEKLLFITNLSKIK